MKWVGYIVDKLGLLIIFGYIIAVAITVTTPAEPKEPVDLPEKTTYVYLGEFTVTGYCPCKICCGEWTGSLTASGTVPTPRRTCGADWNTLTPGMVIHIDGIDEYVVEDKPADWVCDKYDGKVIDVYFETHQEAETFGKHTLKVWEVKR